MADEQKAKLRLEIAHVLFIDIVGYSKLLLKPQSELLGELNEIVSGTNEFRQAESAGKLIRLPTGDGMALVFRTNPEAPAQCALEISEALKSHPEIQLRMGIHSGPVNEVVDVNQRANIAGAGINIAQRVMDCGDAGHILLSKHVAEDLEQDEYWQPLLHDLGECEVKHGVRVHVINLYTDGLGNAGTPQKFQQMQVRRPGTESNNLPAQLSSFIGREEEIREIKELLAKTRLLTLSGAGGCGKTRLALRVAADLVSQYPDGVWLVELAPASDPETVTHLIAEALHIGEEPKRALLETLIDALRSKRLLLALDNCEHLLDACARLVGTLLKTCSTLQILATSREALGVAGETIWQVPSLATPDQGAMISPESLSRFEAIQLFTDRAMAVQPRFALTSATAPAVAPICSRLDGIPLAIELAAARMSALSAAQIAERLQESFDLLAHGKRTALPRHQTLRAAMDWSYALLTEPERMLFQRLAVFAGGFCLEAVENICAGDGLQHDQILDSLTGLVEKSLVLVRENDGRMRYRMLEPIRQYGQERLAETGAVAVARGRHVHYFLRLAQQIEPRLLGPEQQEGLDELESEHANLFAALAWAGQHEPAAALKLANALGWFWEKRGFLAEGREWFMRTIAQCGGTAADLRGEAFVRAGRLACWQGDYDHAVALTEQGVRVCEESGNRRWAGMALNNLGGIAAYRGEPDRAVPFCEQSLVVGKELGDDDLIWRSLADLAVVAFVQGDYDRARHRTEEAMQISRQRGYQEAGMLLLRNLGDIECACANTQKAASCYEQTLALARKLGHKRAIAGALDGLGKVAFDRGDYAAARAFYKEGLQAVNEMGHKSLFAITLNINLAELAAEEREFDEARRL